MEHHRLHWSKRFMSATYKAERAFDCGTECRVTRAQLLDGCLIVVNKLASKEMNEGRGLGPGLDPVVYSYDTEL